MLGAQRRAKGRARKCVLCVFSSRRLDYANSPMSRNATKSVTHIEACNSLQLPRRGHDIPLQFLRDDSLPGLRWASWAVPFLWSASGPRSSWATSPFR